jgi:hypothetical protein
MRAARSKHRKWSGRKKDALEVFRVKIEPKSEANWSEKVEQQHDSERCEE